jgi:hypothetical protein
MMPLGDGQAEGVGGVVDLAPRRAPLHAGGARLRVDPHAVQAGQVEEDAVVDAAQAAAVVAPAANGQGQARGRGRTPPWR